MRTQLAPLFIATAFAFEAQAATIDITYNLVPAEGQLAIDHAAGIWEGILVSPVSIKVMVTWLPMGGTALGITFPNGRKDFPSAPLAQTWYATALANSIAGVELNAGENDLEIYLDSGTDWYYGTDGATPNGQYDLVTVALHEMGHGLGFVGLAKKVGTEGSFGLLEMADFAPLITTFPWPQLDTLPGIFDRYLAHAQDGPLTLMENPSSGLGSAMTSDQVYFNGPIAMAANNGEAPRIYAPATFALGSSCVHLNESTYPEGNANELMTPFSSPGHASHWPGPLCIAMLQDIGWTIAPDVAIAEGSTALPAFVVWPNPASTVLYLGTDAYISHAQLSISDTEGRVLTTVFAGSAMDIRALAPGTYIVTMITEGAVRHARFIKEEHIN